MGMEVERQGRRLLRTATQFTQELRVGIHFLRKRAKPRNQETPILAIALTLPTCVTHWANSALVSTPVKWEKWCVFLCTMTKQVIVSTAFLPHCTVLKGSDSELRLPGGRWQVTGYVTKGNQSLFVGYKMGALITFTS